MLRRDPASFRDPDGFVFRLDGAVYRTLTTAAFGRLKRSREFLAAAVELGLLLPFDLDTPVLDGIGMQADELIRSETIPLITYPYEWSFAQLKDAALNTLDVSLLALEHGLTIKDASAFNVQMHKGRMVFIDHTSFEETDGRLPWRPYSQFCRHFLNPLAVASYRDLHTGAFFRLNLDGLAQETANDLLPWRAKFAPSIAMHMLLHNRFIRKSASIEASGATQVGTRGRQADLIRQLRGFIASLEPAAARSNWADYYDKTNYDAENFAQKKALVAAAFQGRALDSIWDLGANDGTFSRLFARDAGRVLALDLDHNAVNAGYLRNREEGCANVHALVYDVANPSPSLGFNNAERPSLEERSRADAILALAVIHHLSITNNIPFAQSAAWFAKRAPELVIEFVGRDDSQVKRLLAQKNVPYDWYDEAKFVDAYASEFEVVSRDAIPNSDRALYRLTRKR